MIGIPKELTGKVQVVQGEYVLDANTNEAEKLAFTRFLEAVSTTTDRAITFIE